MLQSLNDSVVSMVRSEALGGSWRRRSLSQVFQLVEVSCCDVNGRFFFPSTDPLCWAGSKPLTWRVKTNPTSAPPADAAVVHTEYPHVGRETTISTLAGEDLLCSPQLQISMKLCFSLLSCSLCCIFQDSSFHLFVWLYSLLKKKKRDATNLKVKAKVLFLVWSILPW